MLTVTLDGHFFTYINHPSLLAGLRDELALEAEEAAEGTMDQEDQPPAFDPERLQIPVEELTAWQQQEKRQLLRPRITAEAGDTQSLLGTTADIAGLLLEQMAVLTAAISKSKQTDPAIKAAANPIATALAPIRDGVRARTVTLTHQVKGTDAVIEEAADRASKVAGILKAAKDNSKDNSRDNG